MEARTRILCGAACLPWLAIVQPPTAAVAQGGAVVVTEEARLLSSDIESGDDFGAMLGSSGNSAVIGARAEDDACPEGSECESSGAAYIFDLERPGEWVEVAKLTASDASEHAYFGRTAAMDGDTAVIGANIRNDRQGGVYVFERDLGGTDAWGQRALLLPDDTDSDQQFGNYVSIDGETILAAAQLIDAAYVFDRDEFGDWSQTARLVGESVEHNDNFGQFVALDHGTALIGAESDDDGGENAGAAYIFERNPEGDWEEIAKLVAADGEAHDAFGRNGAIHGDLAAVGAPESNDACPKEPDCRSGSVYVFERHTGGMNQWGQVAKITPHDGERSSFFGRAVALYGRILVVGAPGDKDVGQTGGAVYLYRLAPGGFDEWALVEKVKPGDLEAGDRFGYSASIDGSAIVIGADYDSTVFPETGSAYVFRLEPLLSLAVIGSCPGEVTVAVSGASRSGRVALFAGTQGGSDSIPRGRCQETVLDLGEVVGPSVATADLEGNVSWVRTLSEPGCLRAVQTIDLRSCRTSEASPLQ